MRRIPQALEGRSNFWCVTILRARRCRRLQQRINVTLKTRWAQEFNHRGSRPRRHAWWGRSWSSLDTTPFHFARLSPLEAKVGLPGAGADQQAGAALRQAQFKVGHQLLSTQENRERRISGKEN